MELETLGKNLPAILCAAFIGVLFLQSGLDKISDWKGNREWLTSHFSKTVLSVAVPLMLAVLTVMELGTGLLALTAILDVFADGSATLLFSTGVVGAVTVTSLFFGQRVAKDYAGAATLVPYFILHLVLIYLTNPFSK